MHTIAMTMGETGTGELLSFHVDFYTLNSTCVCVICVHVPPCNQFLIDALFKMRLYPIGSMGLVYSPT